MVDDWFVRCATILDDELIANNVADCEDSGSAKSHVQSTLFNKCRYGAHSGITIPIKTN